jgi:hypothetical protein
MWSFTRTILVRGIGSSGLDSIASIPEEIDYGSASTEFTTLVKSHIFIGDVPRETMLCKPAIKEIQRWSF